MRWPACTRTRALYEKARAGFAQLLSRDPKYIDALLGAGAGGDSKRQSRKMRSTISGRAQTLAVQRGNDEARASILRALGVNYGSSTSLRTRFATIGVAGDRTAARPNARHRRQRPDHRANPGRGRGVRIGAEELSRSARALRRPLGDKQGIGDVLNDLGTYFASRGRYNDALTQFKEALQVQREVRNQASEAERSTTSASCTLARQPTMKPRPTSAGRDGEGADQRSEREGRHVAQPRGSLRQDRRVSRPRSGSI